MDTFYITGTSRGIGKAIANQLLERGAFVIGLARHCTISHENYTHLTIDLNDVQAVSSFRFEHIPKSGTVALINNSGMLGEVTNVGKRKATDITTCFNVNTVSPVILMNEFIKVTEPLAVKKVILNISSGAGRYPIASWANYCATKAALDHYTSCLHLEQKQKESPVYCFSIAPGIIDTAMQGEIRSLDQKDFPDVDRFVQYKKEGQLASPDDTASILIKVIDQAAHFDEALLDARKLPLK